MALESKPASGAGAYITGVDLSSLTDSEVRFIRKNLGEYGVVFFRDQSLSPDGHIELANRFGSINVNRFFQPVDGYPLIAEVRKEPTQEKNIGELWHTDHSYDQIPALGSILVARELPDSGGDTLFSSMINAYEALPKDLKEQVEKLTATHSSRHVFGAKRYSESDSKELAGRLGNSDAATQDAVHPVIIKHPISAKRAIYVNPNFTLRINELSESDSQSLLHTLYEHCQKEEFRHSFNWEPGSVAFWDNRATWHKALNNYPGQRRLMHRITVEGEPLLAGA